MWLKCGDAEPIEDPSPQAVADALAAPDDERRMA